MKIKDDIRTFIVIICVCGICIVAAIFFGMKSNYEKLIMVNEYNSFFSNVNYINNYISKIASSDSVTVYNLLDSKYIEVNDITIDNVMNKLGYYSINTSLDVSDMFYTQIKDNFIYYIDGQLYEDAYDDRLLIDDNYSIVIIVDIDTNSYSLYPVNDDNYIDIINSIRKINIENNEYNNIKKDILISKEQICITYLSDFISNIFDDVSGSYDLLSDNMKKIYTNKNSYENFINNNFSLMSSIADKCKMEEIDDKRVYTVIDVNGNNYVFTEESVMNYKVDFYLKES